MDTKQQLSKSSVTLHWLVGLGMIIAMVMGLILEEMERSPEKFDLLKNHMTIGILVLIIAIWRIVVRIKNGLPEPLSEVPAVQKLSSKIVLTFLLVATLLMPISGIFMQIGEGHAVYFFGMELIAKSGTEIDWLETMGKIGHGLGSKLVMLALFLHIAASLKHAIIAKDGTLSRMLGKRVG